MRVAVRPLSSTGFEAEVGAGAVHDAGGGEFVEGRHDHFARLLDCPRACGIAKLAADAVNVRIFAAISLAVSASVVDRARFFRDVSIAVSFPTRSFIPSCLFSGHGNRAAVRQACVYGFLKDPPQTAEPVSMSASCFFRWRKGPLGA